MVRCWGTLPRNLLIISSKTDYIQSFFCLPWISRGIYILIHLFAIPTGRPKALRTKTSLGPCFVYILFSFSELSLYVIITSAHYNPQAKLRRPLVTTKGMWREFVKNTPVYWKARSNYEHLVNAIYLANKHFFLLSMRQKTFVITIQCLFALMYQRLETIIFHPFIAISQECCCCTMVLRNLLLCPGPLWIHCCIYLGRVSSKVVYEGDTFWSPNTGLFYAVLTW